MNYFLSTDKLAELDSSNDVEGKCLEILTPNQMLSRLPISLDQLKLILKNLKTKLGNYCILCTDQKKLTKQLYKSLVDII